MRVENGQLPLLEDSCTCVVCPVHHGLQAPPARAVEQVHRAVLDGRLEIDNEGRVWRAHKRAEVAYGNYLRVRASVDNKLRSTLAHRLVWRHFRGPIPEGLQINHINGDGCDNRPANLELLTPSENGLHRHHILGRGQLTPDARQRGNQTQKAMRRQSQPALPLAL